MGPQYLRRDCKDLRRVDNKELTALILVHIDRQAITFTTLIKLVEIYSKHPVARH